MNRICYPLMIVLGATLVISSASAQPTPALRDTLHQNVNVLESNLSHQKDVAVTVYNNDRALVRDRRDVKLLPGQVSLKFMDVAERILPETVSLKSLSAPGALHILEQNYEYDLMSPSKLMEKYVGREVRLVSHSTETTFHEVAATLLSVNEGPVYQVGKDIYLGHPGQVVLPEIPEELIAKPSLIWLLNNEGTDHEVEATYLTGGISWKADYVITLNKAETAMDVEGWVTLDNRSGATYQNARLKLVAGDVNVVRPEFDGLKAVRAMAAPMAEMAGMVQEAFAEYHLYSLPRRTTIKQNQSKQVSMLSANDVGVKKIYEFRGNPSYYSQRIPRFEKERVAVFLTFWNKAENQMGMPLPAGVMRVYQEDSEGMLQFSGEDRIQHTPKDEEVRLRLGNAFDVVGERKQMDYKSIGPNIHQSEYEIILRNHKEQDIVVDVVEPMAGDWEILKSSMDYKKKDAQTAVFSVPVRKDGETKVTYRVQVRY